MFFLYFKCGLMTHSDVSVQVRRQSFLLVPECRNVSEVSWFLCCPLQVYWCNGAQIASPHDKEILRSIEEQLEPWSSSCWEESLVESSSLRTDPLSQINSGYMEELTSLCFHR